MIRDFKDADKETECIKIENSEKVFKHRQNRESENVFEEKNQHTSVSYGDYLESILTELCPLLMAN